MYFECQPSKNVYRMISVPSQTHFMYHFTYTEMAEWQKWFCKSWYGRENDDNLWEYQTKTREKIAPCKKSALVPIINGNFVFLLDSRCSWKFVFKHMALLKHFLCKIVCFANYQLFRLYIWVPRSCRTGTSSEDEFLCLSSGPTQLSLLINILIKIFCIQFIW